jgi:hypothetical protein
MVADLCAVDRQRPAYLQTVGPHVSASGVGRNRHLSNEHTWYFSSVTDTGTSLPSTYANSGSF